MISLDALSGSFLIVVSMYGSVTSGKHDAEKTLVPLPEAECVADVQAQTEVETYELPFGEVTDGVQLVRGESQHEMVDRFREG